MPARRWPPTGSGTPGACGRRAPTSGAWADCGLPQRRPRRHGTARQPLRADGTAGEPPLRRPGAGSWRFRRCRRTNLLRELVNAPVHLDLMLDWERFRVGRAPRRHGGRPARSRDRGDAPPSRPHRSRCRRLNEAVGVLRFLFAPELGRSLAEVRRAAQRFGGNLGSLADGSCPAGTWRWRHLLQRGAAPAHPARPRSHRSRRGPRGLRSRRSRAGTGRRVRPSTPRFSPPADNARRETCWAS